MYHLQITIRREKNNKTKANEELNHEDQREDVYNQANNRRQRDNDNTYDRMSAQT